MSDRYWAAVSSAFASAEKAVAGLRAAMDTTGRTLDDFGITVRVRETLLPYALEHQPHLLRSKKKRQRKKAARVLGRTMPREHQRRAFQVAVMRKAEGVSGE